VKNPKTNVVDAKKLILNIKEYGAENQKSKQIASTTLNLCDYCFSDGSIVSIPIVLNGVNSILEMSFKFMRPGTLRSPKSPASDVGSTGNIGSLLKTLSASGPRPEDTTSEEKIMTEVTEQKIEVTKEKKEIYEVEKAPPKPKQAKSARRGTAGKLPPHASKNYGSVNGVVAACIAKKEEEHVQSDSDSKLGQIESIMEDEGSDTIDENISSEESSPSDRGYSNIPR